jgi:uncharacterized protein YkwD
MFISFVFGMKLFGLLVFIVYASAYPIDPPILLDVPARPESSDGIVARTPVNGHPGFHSQEIAVYWVTEIMDQINRLRTSVGVRPVRLNSQLRVAARRHARYHQLNPREFSHNQKPGLPGFSGVTLGDRLDGAGYNYEIGLENILKGCSNDPICCFNGWKNSPGHYSNMVNSGATEFGIARTTTDIPGGQVWVLNMGRRL